MRGARPLLAATLVLGWSATAAAHDFWIQPAAFQATPGATVAMTLQVGDGPDRQRSAIPARRVTRFESVGPDGGRTDLKGALTLGAPEGDGAVQLAAPGAHVLVLETDYGGRSHQSAERFNAYLRDEGLTPALEARARAGRTNHDGAERYARRAKAIVQAGPGPQMAVTQPVGLSLEIVPLASPYAAPRPASLPVQVLYDGAPLAEALVKMTDLAQDSAPAEVQTTDGAGKAVFRMPATGDWRLSVVWTRPLGPTEDTDFETVFSSLAFGFR